QHGSAQLQDAACVQQIMRFASAAGALTTLQPGAIAAQPTPQAIAELLQTVADSA
ncbi:MAG: carbohydrate kinase, partial [Leptolyngbya sp. RL_3_1]|nr:carbohydrate kinase [Leptolyngbya sp. RL_3_1]